MGDRRRYHALVQQVIVDATLAQRWLLRQAPHQHDEQAQTITRYATLMRAGYWAHASSAPVVFDQAGVLIDGRCRLEAVRLTGLPVRLWVTGWHFSTPWPLDEAIT